MAEVTVSSYSEFLAAVAVSGDTVIIPEDTVWDCNEVMPDGAAVSIQCAEIIGNGAVIKNARNIGAVKLGTGNPAVYDLTLENVVIDGDSDGYWLSAVFTTRLVLTRCIVSGLFTSNVFRAGMRASVNLVRSSINMEMQNGAFDFNSIASYAQYSRIAVKNTMRAAFTNMIGSCNECELILTFPQVTELSLANIVHSTVRGDLQNVTTIRYYPASVSLLCAEDAPQAVSTSDKLAVVTEAQMRDAAYLNSLGFPIGEV